MTTRFAMLAAFAIGLGVGIVATASIGPHAAERPQLAVTDIAGLDDHIRKIAEECVIAGAGTTLAHLTCRRDAF